MHGAAVELTPRVVPGQRRVHALWQARVGIGNQPLQRVAQRRSGRLHFAKRNRGIQQRTEARASG